MFDFCLFCKQKTAYEMRISDWSSDVCSSDLIDRVRDLAEPGKVYLARISRAAGNDQLGMIFAGEFGDGIIVDPLVSLADSILDGVQPFARKGGCCAMGEMAAMREAHAHQGIARLEQRIGDRHIEIGRAHV